MTIIVYSSPNCVQCTHTKKVLDKEKLPYTEVDVTVDMAAGDALRMAGHTTLPVVVAGDESWAGFKPHRIRALVMED